MAIKIMSDRYSGKSRWQLVHPRCAFFFQMAVPMQIALLAFTLLILIPLIIFVAFGAAYALGLAGLGPLAAMAQADKDRTSVILGAGVGVLFLWLMIASVKKQWQDITNPLRSVEGRIESAKEDFDITDGGRSHYVLVKLRGEEFILPHRLLEIAKPGVMLKLDIWPASNTIRSAWISVN